MRKNRKKVFVREPSKQEQEKLAWQEFRDRVLVLPFVAIALWGVMAGMWITGDNYDPSFIVAWSVCSTGPAAVTLGVLDSLADRYCEWREAYEAVLAIPRNRRVSSRVSWFNWGGWVH